MESLNIIALGIAVRLAREDKQLTSNDLAIQVGMSPSSLSRSERGLRMLELDEAVRIATTLGLTTNDLVEQAKRIELSGVAKQHKQALEQIDRSLKKVREAALRARLGSNVDTDGGEPATQPAETTSRTRQRDSSLA